MRIISKRTVRGYWRKYPDAEEWLRAWITIAEDAHWHNLQEVRRNYPHADGVKVESERILTVFNVHGNKYRLIVSTHDKTECIYVREFLTHREYDSNAWIRRN